MTLPPIHRQIVVPASPQAAFEVFTERIGTWWPIVSFSVHGAGSTAAFQDGQLVETAPSGEAAVWGTVLDWQPARSFRMTWHPGDDPANASVVTVTFAPVGDYATLVTVRHEGWETTQRRDEYRNGWPAVLQGLAAEFTRRPEDHEPLLIVLSHVSAPGVADPFADPRFAGHARFLAGLDKQGILVGAGPFAGTGEGMTIVRVPGPAAAADLVRAAQFEDESVAGGLLEVVARSWTVVMHGAPLA